MAHSLSMKHPQEALMTTRINQSALDEQLAEAKAELNQVAQELAGMFGERLEDPELPEDQRHDLETATSIIREIRRLCAL
jgi:hypothetical protein